MSEKMQLVAEGINVQKLYWTLMQHPELWNQNTERTVNENSPHHGLDDIWVRYGDRQCALDGSPHESYWYPAEDVLNVKEFCYDLMRAVGGVELGGVLITRIPPGAECKPHDDIGWHANRYDKYALQIASAPGQAFHFEGESLESKPGDLYWFDNKYVHWVPNPTNYERITMIVCIRKDKKCLG